MRLLRHLHWHAARVLYAVDALVLGYRVPQWTLLVCWLWPTGYSRECPGWAITMQERWQRRRR